MEKHNGKMLVKPSGCKVMGEEDMVYTEGGSVKLKMKRDYLSKSFCIGKGNALKGSKLVKSMSAQAIAEEIFAHAILYYKAKSLNAAGVKSSILNEIKRRASVVDIDDGGDKWYRRVAYTALWNNN